MFGNVLGIQNRECHKVVRLFSFESQELRVKEENRDSGQEKERERK